MKRPNYSAVFMFLPVIGLFLLGMSPSSAETPGAPPETIILISLDTTRADRMSCYGYEHETTPNIDALAKESLFFEHPFSTVPMTLPSHSSMFTGLIPATHGVHENTRSNLPQSVVTLPEILKEHGFTTYGIVSTLVLKADRGLSQGFDYYDDAIDAGATQLAMYGLEGEQNGKETTARALRWLSENAEKKKFMFIHYFDAHAEFKPPAPFDTRFKDPYDGEIAFTDFCVGQILDRLKALGLYENALIALVGDHGEMLGEHGETYHSFFIYQNVLRVPMMFKLPGAIQSRSIKEPCSLLDVTPTLLSMAGLAVPEAMQGVDLARYLRPDFTLPDRAIYAESMTPTNFNCSSLLGIVMGRWHYIQTTRPELYDRLEDPGELNNLIAQNSAQASKMKARLKRILSEAERLEFDNSAALDAETLEQLAGLGYMGDNVVPDYSFEEGQEDAKDMIGVRDRIFAARRMGRAGQRDLAVKSCTEIIEQYPDIAETYRNLAAIHAKLKEFDLAIAVLEQKLTRFPEDRNAMSNLSNFYTLREEYSKAIPILNKLIAQKTDDATPYDSLIDIYVKQKSFDEAIVVVQRRRKVLPDDAKILFTLGKIYQGLNDAPNALVSFLEALKFDTKSLRVLISTAATYLKMGNRWQALSHYEKALAQNTDLPKIHGMVARLKMTKEDPQLFDPPSALKHAEQALQIHEDLAGGQCDIPTVFDTLSVAWAINGNFDEAIKAAVRALELYKMNGAPAQADRMKRLIEEFKKRNEELGHPPL